MDTYDHLECLKSRSKTACAGDVELFAALSGTGTLIPYCIHHWDEAVERHYQTLQDYPVHPPSWFDPAYAGERWDNDY